MAPQSLSILQYVKLTIDLLPEKLFSSDTVGTRWRCFTWMIASGRSLTKSRTADATVFSTLIVSIISYYQIIYVLLRFVASPKAR